MRLRPSRSVLRKAVPGGRALFRARRGTACRNRSGTNRWPADGKVAPKVPPCPPFRNGLRVFADGIQGDAHTERRRATSAGAPADRRSDERNAHGKVNGWLALLWLCYLRHSVLPDWYGWLASSFRLFGKTAALCHCRPNLTPAEPSLPWLHLGTTSCHYMLSCTHVGPGVSRPGSPLAWRAASLIWRKLPAGAAPSPLVYPRAGTRWALLLWCTALRHAAGACLGQPWHCTVIAVPSTIGAVAFRWRCGPVFAVRRGRQSAANRRHRETRDAPRLFFVSWSR